VKEKEVKRENQVFEPNVMSRRDIISYFKDLINIGPLLDIDWEKELILFKKKLEKVGWGTEQIEWMEQIACSKSIYLRDLPPVIRNKGNWRRWLVTKSLHTR